MNQLESPGGREARVEYKKDGDFQIISHGNYVVCAITGRRIPLDELRYWSVARQEAYVDAPASFEAEKRAGALPTQSR